MSATLLLTMHIWPAETEDYTITANSPESQLNKQDSRLVYNVQQRCCCCFFAAAIDKGLEGKLIDEINYRYWYELILLSLSVFLCCWTITEVINKFYWFFSSVSFRSFFDVASTMTEKPCNMQFFDVVCSSELLSIQLEMNLQQKKNATRVSCKF